jgi:hypothetical protein
MCIANGASPILHPHRPECALGSCLALTCCEVPMRVLTVKLVACGVREPLHRQLALGTGSSQPGEV